MQADKIRPLDGAQWVLYCMYVPSKWRLEELRQWLGKIEKLLEGTTGDAMMFPVARLFKALFLFPFG
jgi:hypothetical protein